MMVPGTNEALTALHRSQGLYPDITTSTTNPRNGVPMSRPNTKYRNDLGEAKPPLKACFDADPELFFPADKPNKLAPAERAAYDAQVKEAKDHCAVCPFATECLKAAFDLRIEYGIWGGTTPEERRRRLQADAAHVKQGQTTLADFGTRAELVVAA
jgi:WhiB family redox-sensing transcriptional regulator